MTACQPTAHSATALAASWGSADSPLPPDGLPVLFKTLMFACEKHSDQRRKDPEQTPYINHPIGVASFLVEAGVTDLVTLQAALLHDTIEDTDTTPQEITALFGEAVCRVVLECTDDMALPPSERKRIQVRKAASASYDAKLVKLADKLYNLLDLCRAVPVGWTPRRVQAYFAWSKQVIDCCAGTSPILEARLNYLFEHGTFTFNGQKHKCLCRSVPFN